MGILNPLAANFNVDVGTTQLVYTCPSGKSHALVDLTFFKDNIDNAMIQVGISTGAAGTLTSVDYFIDDLELLGANKTAELTKIVIGKNENLYVKVISGNVNVRVSGMEENNTKVGLAGKLAAANIPNASEQVKVFETVTVGAAYATTSVTLFNTNATTDAVMEVWITSGATPVAADKVLETAVLKEDTVIIENLMLLPNEKVFVRSNLANTEYFVNGFVVLA